MNYLIRPLTEDDKPFMWKMLYYAAHMDEDGETSLQAAERNPYLIRYVNDWGRKGDMGFIALEPLHLQPVGATWLRLLLGAEKTFSYIDDATPELVIATLPDFIGKGVGTQLLLHLLEAAKGSYPAIVLSVRETNPAKRLYDRMGFVVVGSATNRVGTASFNMLRPF